MSTMPYLRIAKDGEELYAPLFPSKKSAETVTKSSTPLPSKVDFFIHRTLHDKINNITPIGYYDAEIVNGAMIGSSLNCRLKNNKFELEKTFDGGQVGSIKYQNIPIDFTNMVVSIQAGGYYMSNMTYSDGHDYVIDIGHMFYIIKLTATPNYILRTRPDAGGTATDFDLGLLDGESNITSVFNGSNLKIYVNGKLRLNTDSATYPKSTVDTTVGIGCRYSGTSIAEQVDCYVVSCLIGEYLGSSWQGTDGEVAESYMEIIGANKGEFTSSFKTCEDSVYQNTMVVRNQYGEVGYSRNWFFTSD